MIIRNTVNNHIRSICTSMCGAVLLVSGGIAYSQTGEDVFEGATAYTVQIRTLVDIPFIGDRKSSSMGAGFVVDASRGWIMTNAHVAARSPSLVRVKLRHGEYHEAKKLYVDPYLDLAILELTGTQRKELTAARLDCGELPSVGHSVGAFGHPWGLTYTGTRGIVSGVTSRMGGEMLQTDAPINGGNSGGPLVSLQTGEIVGVSTASINKEDAQNTNFAVPMKYACNILHLLQQGKDPSPPNLSTIFFEDLDDEGNLIVAETYLENGSIALQSGDVIENLEGIPGKIRNEGQLVNLLRGRLRDVHLKVIRSGTSVTIEGQLAPVDWITERKGVYASGILFAPAPFVDNRTLNLDKPLMVHSLEPGSLGESLEIEKWDFLVEIDGRPVHGLRDLYERLETAQRSKKPVSIMLKRWSDSHNRLYDFVERMVWLDDLIFVSPTLNDQVASTLLKGDSMVDKTRDVR
jgi:S1-C subfamily serine protease